MIRSIAKAVLSPIPFVLLGAGLVTMTVVTPPPEPTPQIIVIEVTPEPIPTPTPTPSPSPTPSLLPDPFPSLAPLSSSPPLPPEPVCDRESKGNHHGWENSGRECPGPDPLPALFGAVGLLLVMLRHA